VLRRRTGTSPTLGGARTQTGYEIRHGRVAHDGDAEPLLRADDGEPDGCRIGQTFGTSWHGAFEGDELRRALLGAVAAARARTFVPGTGSFAAARERRLDVLGNLVEQHLDTDAVLALLRDGAPTDLPNIHAEVRQWSVS
jgi:adenosylcobyric acid synthase